MIDQPQIVQSPAHLTAVIRLTIPRSEIRNVMGPAVCEVISTVAAQGIAPTGPLFSYHLSMQPDTFDFEVGVPVSKSVAAAGRVKPGQLRAAKVARATCRGPYEGLGEAWGELGAWIKANNHKPAPDFWECYAAGPESSPDPTTWRTELNRPLIG